MGDANTLSSELHSDVTITIPQSVTNEKTKDSCQLELCSDTDNDIYDSETENNSNLHSIDPQEEAICTIFVGGLTLKTTDTDLHSYFSQFGELVRWVVKINPKNNRSLRFGFVVYKDVADAIKVASLQPHKLCGKVVNVRHSKKPDPALSMDNRISVYGCFNHVTRADLKTYFGKFGFVEKTHYKRTWRVKKRNRNKSFKAYIRFKNPNVISKVVAEKNHTINGQSFEVEKALSRRQEDKNKGKSDTSFASQRYERIQEKNETKTDNNNIKNVTKNHKNKNKKITTWRKLSRNRKKQIKELAADLRTAGSMRLREKLSHPQHSCPSDYGSKSNSMADWNSDEFKYNPRPTSHTFLNHSQQWKGYNESNISFSLESLSSGREIDPSMGRDYGSLINKELDLSMGREYASSINRKIDPSNNRGYRTSINREDPSMGIEYESSIHEEFGPHTVKEYGASMNKQFNPRMGREYGSFVNRQFDHFIDREYASSWDREYEPSMGREYESSKDRECGPSLGREYASPMDRECGPSLGRECVSPMDRDSSRGRGYGHSINYSY